MTSKKISIVIPCYKVKNQIINVLKKLNDKDINCIYVVDDCCPDSSGDVVQNYLIENKISNIKIIKNEKNLGVGGATKRGFEEAVKDNNDIVIKLDGDDQMDINNIDKLIKRNENIMGSNHPWKSKIQTDLGNTLKKRRSNLRKHYERVKRARGASYWGGSKNYNPETDPFYRRLITKLNGG